MAVAKKNTKAHMKLDYGKALGSYNVMGLDPAAGNEDIYLLAEAVTALQGGNAFDLYAYNDSELVDE